MDNGFPGMDPYWKPSEFKSDNPLTLAKLESSNYIMLLGSERLENGKLRKLLDEAFDIIDAHLSGSYPDWLDEARNILGYSAD